MDTYAATKKPIQSKDLIAMTNLPLKPEDLDEIEAVAKVIGDALGIQRDYRKELWIATYAGSLNRNGEYLVARMDADKAVELFDERITKGLL